MEFNKIQEFSVVITLGLDGKRECRLLNLLTARVSGVQANISCINNTKPKGLVRLQMLLQSSTVTLFLWRCVDPSSLSVISALLWCSISPFLPIWCHLFPLFRLLELTVLSAFLASLVAVEIRLTLDNVLKKRQLWWRHFSSQHFARLTPVVTLTDTSSAVIFRYNQEMKSSFRLFRFAPSSQFRSCECQIY